MPVYFNGTNITSNFVYNGVTIDNVYFNGTKVYTSVPPWTPSWSGESIAAVEIGGIYGFYSGWQISGASFRGYYLYSTAVVGNWKLVNSNATMTPTGLSQATNGTGFYVSGTTIRASSESGGLGNSVTMKIGGGFSADTNIFTGITGVGLHTSGVSMRAFGRNNNNVSGYGVWRTL